VIAAFLAAILTPPDAVSMMLMLGPLLLLYEISIWCAWVASRRRARRVAAAMVVLVLLGAGSLRAQNPPPAPPTPPRRLSRDTAAVMRPPADYRARGSRGHLHCPQDGTPAAPTRSFPPPDAVIDSLIKLQNYRITRYMADTIVVEGDSQTTFLREEAFRGARPDTAPGRLDPLPRGQLPARCGGSSQLFEQGTVLVRRRDAYDTCVRRGTVRDALTDFQQGGATWYVHGDIAADSGNKRVYVASANFTSDPQPVPRLSLRGPAR